MQQFLVQFTKSNVTSPRALYTTSHISWISIRTDLDEDLNFDDIGLETLQIKNLRLNISFDLGPCFIRRTLAVHGCILLKIKIL